MKLLSLALISCSLMLAQQGIINPFNGNANSMMRQYQQQPLPMQPPQMQQPQMYLPMMQQPLAPSSSTGFAVGNQIYRNNSDGSFSTSTQLGNRTITRFNDGSSCTATRIGQLIFTNCQ